ncbi:MAG TPA: hypothetical protein VJL35_02140, partial [Gemmatimonadaceae bacterium]|nr:hypothetical protein [Gemmatimonadaceae bacterium]
MKTLEVLRFEVEYQAKRWWTWLYFAVLLVVPFLIATQGAVQGPAVSGYWFNSAYGIGLLTMIGGFLGLIATAAFAGEAGARDPESRMESLVYTSPVAERSYIVGRFLAAFVLTAAALVMVQIALVVGTLIVDLPPELMAPITSATYLNSYIVFALPNAFLATALFFAFSLFTRRSVTGYLTAIVLFFMSLMVWLVVAGKFGRWDIAKVLDPLAMSVIQQLGNTTTAAQKNAWQPWSDSSLLLNRLLWITVGIAALLFTHFRFNFKAASERKSWRRALPSVEAIERVVPLAVPRVTTSTGVGVRLQQLGVITMQSFRHIVFSWGALVLVILSLILAVTGTM